MRLSPAALLPLLAAIACSEPPPPVPVVKIAQTADTTVAPAILLSDARPLADGRWVVIAPVEFALHVVDFTARTAVPFPQLTQAEVPGPSTLMAAADTMLIGDWGLQRVTAWLVGQPRLEAIPIPEAAGGALPRARDAAGQWYFEGAVTPGRDGSGLGDSSRIIRSDAMLARFDTIAALSPPDLAVVQRDGGQRYERRVLSGRDRWGVLNDGTLWIARFRQNVVEWWNQDGTLRTKTKPLPDPILAVREMDRQIYLSRFPEEQRQTARTLPFAELKPPFEAAFATPDGRIWLFKSAPALDSVRTFQVVDSSGVRAMVEVPSRGNALGVTSEWILMGEEFPDGVRLLRYPVPAAAKAN
jgi:hypothetical protein